MLKQYAFTGGSGEGQSQVGRKKGNAFGLYDMHGNALEWCADWFARDYYRSSPSIDPAGPASGTDKVNRGGGFLHSPLATRSARRSKDAPDWNNFEFSFRIARKATRKVALSPHLAKAPFTAAEAKSYQERWAAHLGTPITRKNSRGMSLVLIRQASLKWEVARKR